MKLSVYKIILNIPSLTYKLTLIAFVLFSTASNLIAQFNIDTPEITHREIKIVNEDSIVLAHILTRKTEINKIESDKRYYWYNKGKINSNLGGFHGTLLDGKFELLVKGNLSITGEFDTGLKTGMWKIWNLNGTYNSTQNWDDGQLNGELLTYYENREVNEKTNFKGGVKNGKYYKFSREGELLESGKFKANKKVGKHYTYNPNGKPKVERYVNGKLKVKKTKKIKEKKPKRINEDESDHTPFLKKIFKKKKIDKQNKKPFSQKK